MCLFANTFTESNGLMCDPIFNSNVVPVNGTQVLEYLNKKGYSKTEATLRREVADRDNNGPIARKVQDKGWEKYVESYGLFTCALELFVITEIRSTARKLRRRQSRSLQA